jgi:uncharacterized protein (TIGR04141 family)
MKLVSKIVLYKLNSAFTKAELSEYQRVGTGQKDGWNYEIFVKAIENHSPSWQPLIEDLVSSELPKNSYASLVILFSRENSIFALTAGYGYVDVRNFSEDNFGIDVACKSLDPSKLDNLFQKVPTGSVYGLSRTLRGKYMPANDIINERSVLKSLKGKTLNGALGATVEGRTSLSISGKKSFDDVIRILTEVEEIQRKTSRTVEIKGLEEVSKDTREKLHAQLLNVITIGQFDNILLGYDDELIYSNCEYIKVGRDSAEYLFDDNISILNSAKRQSSTDPALVGVVGFDHNKQKIFRKRLVDLIEGEMDYNGDKYFRIDKRWYKTNQEYIKNIEKDFKRLDVIDSSYFSVWPKQKTNNDYVHEDDFIKLNTDKTRIVAHTKKINNIEIADLIDQSNKYLIHIKKGKGAYLRNLFAQGFVSSSLLAGEASFLAKAKSKFGIDRPSEYTIIYAIFAEGNVSLDSIFTLFAKVDLLERASSLQGMGYKVSYCIIQG